MRKRWWVVLLAVGLVGVLLAVLAAARPWYDAHRLQGVWTDGDRRLTVTGDLMVFTFPDGSSDPGNYFILDPWREPKRITLIHSDGKQVRRTHGFDRVVNGRYGYWERGSNGVNDGVYALNGDRLTVVLGLAGPPVPGRLDDTGDGIYRMDFHRE